MMAGLNSNLIDFGYILLLQVAGCRLQVKFQNFTC
jgi:hypothetical protein